MTERSLTITCGALLLVAASACSTPAPRYQEYPVRLADGVYTVTDLDYFQWGLDEARIAGETEPFAGFMQAGELAPRFRRDAVRVNSWEMNKAGSSIYGISSGSGILLHSVDGIVLLSARHVIGTGPNECRVFATGVSGVRMELAGPWLLESLFNGRDVCLMKRSGNASGDSASFDHSRWPRTRAARIGEPVVLVGYPSGSAGRTTDGSIKFSPPQLEAPLEPLYTFGKIVSTRPLRAVFVGGLIPSRGMSGSPLWATDGALLGISVKAVTRWESDGPRIEGEFESMTNLSAVARTASLASLASVSSTLSTEEANAAPSK